ncbi:MAG: beta-ketoacyl-[acyl-carrier-protein] synthase family protein [Pseudonocardia sp.]
MTAASRIDGRPRVLVTGLGVLTPVGVGHLDFHTAQIEARCGIRAITRFDASGHGVRIAGEVDVPPDLELSRRERVAIDRCALLASLAGYLAVQHSGVEVGNDDPTRFGVALGCGMGGVSTVEESVRGFLGDGERGVRPRSVPMGMINDAAGRLAMRHGFRGPCTTVATACASGSDAVATAYQMIATGEADVVLAGGTEAPVVAGVVAGFTRLGALSPNPDPRSASRPFSADRDGFVLAEGAAVLVLESAAHARRRGADAHAELLGFGRSCDAFHVTMPRPDGAGARDAMAAALRSARVDVEDVGYVNAHGTGTVLNDDAEVAALRSVLGCRLTETHVSATKSMTGHSLGAAGAIEAVSTVQALSSGIVPPTANLERLDPGFEGVRLAPEPVETKPAVALSNSFGFGGHNVVLALARC